MTIPDACRAPLAASYGVAGADGSPSDEGRNAAAAGASTRLTHLQSIGEAVEESSDEASSAVGGSSDDAGGAAAAVRRGAAHARGDPPPASPAPIHGRGCGRPALGRCQLWWRRRANRGHARGQHAAEHYAAVPGEDRQQLLHW